jgi:N-carbamoylputrescine amidase
MTKTVKVAIVQVANKLDTGASCEEHREAMLAAHIPYVEQAGSAGVQMLCFQEIFTGPYFCPSQDTKWYGMAEAIPDGPTTQLMCEYAKKHAMVIVVPIYEEEMPGLYYNTAAVIDADGRFLGKYRKNHLPQVAGFWEKFFFRPGNLGYPVFKTRYGRVGVYICYDRHFPEGARCLGLNGADIVFNPSATVAGLSRHLWELEQTAHAAANGYYIAAINRVGEEAPWNIGRFYGSSYFADPRGQIIAQASEDEDEMLIAELDFDLNREVRNTWQFYRDRRPETYNGITEA